MANTRLYIAYESNAQDAVETNPYNEATGLVIDADRLNPDEVENPAAHVAVIHTKDPGGHASWHEREGVMWSSDRELEVIAQMRDQWPDLQWLPRLDIYQPEVVYQFNADSMGEGFKFYIPDTGAIQAYRTLVSDKPLESQLTRAAALGFTTLWLHATHADQTGKGFDLELLDRASVGFDGEIWLSGGASDEQHLLNLTRQGGAAAVVVSQDFARQSGCDRLQLALTTGEETGVPVTFDSRKVETAQRTS